MRAVFYFCISFIRQLRPLVILLGFSCCFGSDAFSADDCAGLAETSVLCRLVTLPPKDGVLPPRAPGAISAFVAAKIKDAAFAKGEVELGLFTLLPQDVQDSCKKASRSDGLGAALICLRPACFRNAPAEQCKPLLESLAVGQKDQLRAVLSSASPCPSEHLCSVSAEAVELILATDLLRDFLSTEIAASWPEICPENKVAPCTRRLQSMAERMASQYAIGSAWHLAITGLRTSGNVRFGAQILSRLPEADRFENAWSSVLKIAGDAKDQKAASLAMIKPEIQSALAGAAAPLNELIRVVNERIDNERFELASKQFENIQKFLNAAPPSAGDLENIRQQFMALGKLTRTDSRWRDTAASLRTLSTRLDGLQPKLLEQAEKSLLAMEKQACVSGQSRFDPSAGIAEFCYKPDPNAALQIVGLRFKFPPCATKVVRCSVDGDLALVWRIGRDGPAVIQPLGLVDVRSLISPEPNQKSARLTLRERAPSPLAFRRDDGALADAITRLFAPSITARPIQVDVSDGPEVRLILSLGLNLAGLSDVTQATITLTPTGINLDGQNSVDNLVSAVAQKILANVGGKSFQFRNWTLQALSARPVTGCKGTSNFEVTARGSLSATLPSVEYLLSLCDGKASISLQPNQRLLVQALARQLKQLDGPDVRLFIASDDHVHAAVNHSIGRCAFPIDLDLQGGFKDAFAKATNGLQCAVSEATKEVVFTLASGLGFKKTTQPDTYCTDPVPGVGVLCVTGVKPPFTAVSASLQNEAQALQAVRGGLRSLLGDAAVVKTIQLKDGHVAVVADLTLPGLGQVNDVNFEISNKGLSGSFQPAFHAALNSVLGGKTENIAGVQVSNISVLDDAPLALRGNISYGALSAPVRVEILPNLKITPQKPDLNSLLSALKQVLGSVSAVKDFRFIDSPEGAPALQAEVEVSVPLVGQDFAVSAILEAKAGGALKFAGPVSIRLPLPWIDIWWLALGRIRSRLDLNKPLNDISIGASLTIIPGDGSYEIIGLDGDLHIKPGSVGLDSTLSLISIPFGRTTGQWRYSEGMLEVDIGAASLPDIVPLPSGHLVVDGRACAVAGSASAKFMGAQIASLNAGALIGGLCKAGPARDNLINKLIEQCGADRGPIGRMCIFGDVRFGAINGTGKFNSRLDQIFPNISGDIDLTGLAHFSVGVNAARAKLSTSVLGFRLAIVLPNVEGLDEAFLRRLIENLLKPSIDLEALLRGEITIAPASKKGRGDDAMVDSSDAKPDSPDGQNPPSPDKGPRPSQLNPPQPASAPPKVGGGGDYRGQPGPIKLTVRQYESSEYWQVYESLGNQQIPWLPFYFSKADAADLRSGQLVVFSHIPSEHSNSVVLLACDGWPCETRGVVGVTAYKIPDKSVMPGQRIKIDVDDALRTVTSSDDSFKSFNPRPNGIFTYPAIITYAAGLAIDRKKLPISLVCARKTAGSCVIEYWHDPEVVALIRRGDYSIHAIPMAAWGHLALVKACQAQCDESKIGPFLDFEGFFLSLNSRLSPPVAAKRDYKWDASHGFTVVDTLEVLQPGDLSKVKSWPLNLHLVGYRSFGLWDPIISHPLLEDLLGAIAATATPDASISLWSLSEQFASALLTDKGVITLWSAVRQNEKSCVRQRSLQDIAAELTKWSKQGFVETAYAEKLNKPEGLDKLMQSLSAPTLLPGQFNLNPLLLFGDPAMAVSCK